MKYLVDEMTAPEVVLISSGTKSRRAADRVGVDP